jgi:myo-inositol-hexaphosphate 3-phosphohydrolase
MLDSWKDAFTVVGGFAATALTVITIQKGQQKPALNITTEEKAALMESVSNLLQHYNDLRLDIAELKRDYEHISEKIDAMAAHAQRDHDEVKKLTLILYPLIKNHMNKED